MEDKDILYISKVLENPELILTEEFQEWMKDKDNAELFWNLKAAFDKLALENMKLPYLTTEWEVFCRRVESEHALLNKQKRGLSLRKFVNWSVAASLFLITISSAYFLTRTTTQQENIIVVESLPQPQIVLLTNDTLPDDYQSANNNPVIYNIIQTPRGRDTICILNDGTEIKLNAESVLKYPSNFSKSARIVQLEGEAYFNVSHDKARPFIVESHGVQTQVLGTIFNIKAISESQINVTLVEGSVSVQNIENKIPVLLHPGQDASFRKKDGSFNIKEVNVALYTAWTQGYFHFDNAPLVDIMRELGHWYNINVEFAEVEVMQLHFNFWVNRNEDIMQALNLLQKVGKTKFICKNNTIVVYANKSN